MKKKILATLLAVCLFVGIAVPAVLAASSDAAGDAKKVTKITIAKAEYTITEGGFIDFADEIAVYENDKKLVLDHGHIQYSLLANVGASSDFKIEGSKVTALKPGVTATLTIFDNYGEKARTTAKIKSVAASAASSKAIESYTFSSSLYTLPVGADAENQTVVVESHPKGTTFTPAAIATATTEVTAELEVALDSGVVLEVNEIADGTKLEFVLDAAILETLDPSATNIPVEVTDINFVNAKEFKASTALRLVPAVKATGLSVKQDVTVKVGEKVDTPAVTYYPTNANVGKKVVWDVIPYINDSNAYQYAIVDDGKILGVNANTPAKVRLRASMIFMNNLSEEVTATTECIVNVKSATFTGQVTPFISKTSGELKVGEKMALEVSNLPAGVTVAWSFESTVAGIVDYSAWTGAKTNLYAKKVGTLKAVATLSNGEVYKADITVKAAAAATTPSTSTPTAPSTNPQTGDSFFNLF